MTFKVLKHKTLPDTFGVLLPFPDGSYEIAHSDIPDLMNEDATIEKVEKYWASNNHRIVVEQLNDYNLVEVELKIK